MSGALSAPVYEINPESSYYKTIKQVKDDRHKVRAIIEDIAKDHGFDPDEFTYYGSKGFGFMGSSKGFDKFRDQLMKRADHNNVFLFKRNSKTHKAISPRMVAVSEMTTKGSPFTLSEIFGYNNLKASHWVGDRHFVQAKTTEGVEEAQAGQGRSQQFPVEPAIFIPFREYLEILTDHLDKNPED